MILEFLIPAYKRPDQVLRAAESVIKQLPSTKTGSIGIWINDDYSPEDPIPRLRDLTDIVPRTYQHAIRISRNEENLGMSLNILHMVRNTKGLYWTVLTDDDYIEEDSLTEIAGTVSFANANHLGLVFTPRYSYLENGALYCIECRYLKKYPAILRNGPINAIQHMKNAFILTGMICRSDIDIRAWDINVENSFFPVINFGSALIRNSCLVVDQRWFHHTVMNKTHWETWGKDDKEQFRRLAYDFLRAQEIIFHMARERAYLARLPILLIAYLVIRNEYIRHVIASIGWKSFLGIGRNLPMGLLGSFLWVVFIKFCDCALRPLELFRRFSRSLFRSCA